MTTKTRPQIHMDETIVENPELEKMLEDRQKLKQSVAEFRKIDKDVKAKIASIGTQTPYRVGRFVISKRDITAKSVSFETQASFSFVIKLAGEE
ncbi:hypothetical protein ES708_34881 [subsurface metagenome]